MVFLLLTPWLAVAGDVREEFLPIEDNPNLPRVLLIGDSISMGYTLPVRKKLEGEANVHRPAMNCGPTSRGVKHLDEWLGDGDWHVIHFNFGLHDLKVMEETGEHQVPIDEYEENLEQMVARMKQTGAELVWASTTPVPDPVNGPERRAEDVVKYNKVAEAVMREHSVAIDDLYEFALPQLEVIQLPENVHFPPEGSEVLARQVAESIRQALVGPKTTGVK
ncbi:MAG: SGNH/GDSL hydrolase family protein [Armatimonadota bacterium]